MGKPRRYSLITVFTYRKRTLTSLLNKVTFSETIQVLLCIFCGGADSSTAEEAKDASAAAGKDF